MPIKVGDTLPNTTFRVMTADGPKPKPSEEVFKGRKVVLFAVPGAFTPTCSKNHLPGFVKNASAIKAKGIDAIAVTAVNDPFVMAAWKDAAGSDDIEFLADGSADFAKADRARARRLGRRARHPLQALLHGGRRRRGEVAGDRGRARQGRRLGRRCAAEVAVDSAFNPPQLRRLRSSSREVLGGHRGQPDLSRRIARDAPQAEPKDALLRLQPDLRNARARELIGALVQVMAGMAFHPMPFDLVMADRRHRAAATDRHSSPASCRRCASRSSSSP